MNIVVDYGNSSAKVGIFDGYNLTTQYNFKKEEELKEFLQNFSAVNFIISSVTKIQPRFCPGRLRQNANLF
jgi:type III pantothenate kinase